MEESQYIQKDTELIIGRYFGLWTLTNYLKKKKKNCNLINMAKIMLTSLTEVSLSGSLRMYVFLRFRS